VDQSGVTELANPGGQFIVTGDLSISTVQPQVAADNAGHVWINESGSVCQVPPYEGKGTTPVLQFGSNCWGNANSSGSGELNFYNSQGIALDGSGIAWIASQGGGSNPPIVPSVLPIASPSVLANFINPTLLESPSLAGSPLRVAVDGSANVWVLLANSTVTEYVGAATPAVTPIALAEKNNKLGSKP
jgi:hypothetical protein